MVIHQRKLLHGLLCLLVCCVSGLVSAAESAVTSSQVMLRQSGLATAQVQANKPLQQFKFIPLQAKVLAKLKPVKVDNNKPQGPDANASLSLDDVINDAALLENIQKKVGWDSHLIFQDKAVSNLFYYLPRELLLIRDKEGYHLSAQYNTAQEQGQASVMLTAEVTAPHQAGDIALLKALLAQALQLSSPDKVSVKAFPALNMQINLQALGAGLAIAQDRMQIVAPSHLAKPVRLILNLTQDETEAALTQIAHEGLLGSVEIPVGDQKVRTSLRVQYSDYAGNSLGGINKWLAGGSIEQIQNESAFPISIGSINAYLIKGRELELQRKELKSSSVIEPGAERSFKLPTINTLFGTGIVFVWFETEQQTECVKCLEAIRNEVTRGISASPAGSVNIEVIPAVFSEWDLYKVQLEIRSPYFTPQGKKLENRNLEFTEESGAQQLKLYFPGNKGPSPLLFRYRLSVVRNDGQQISSAEWYDSHEMGLILGSYQLSPLLSKE